MQDTQETQVQYLGWEDPLEEEMATHSTLFAWRILWTEEPGGLQSTGSQRVGQDLETEHICVNPCAHVHREDNGLPYGIKHRKYSRSIEETGNGS